MGIFPFKSACIFSSLTSIQVTFTPISAKQVPETRPTYPVAFSSDTSILTGTSALYTPDAVSGVMTDIAGAHVSTTNPFVLIYETLPLKSVTLT